MGKRAPAAPTPPDPVATAQAQGQMNVETARTQNAMNRVNQITPYGSLEFQDLGNDRWSATTTLSPSQQRQLQTTNQGQEIYGQAALSQLQQVQGALSQPFQFGGPGVQTAVTDRGGQVQQHLAIADRPDFTGIGDPNQGREAVQAALLARINPDLERERAGLEQRMANQGFTMGSEAWNTGMGDYGRQANDARYGAILNAGQEQSRMVGLGLQQAGFGNDARLAQAGFGNQAQQQLYGMDLGRAQFGNAAQQQSLQQQLAMRAQPINEAAALLSGQQIQSPQFQAVPQVGVAAPDYQGAVGQNYAGQMAGWQQQVQAAGAGNAAFGNALGALGGAGLMAFSDRRLKRDVRRIGTGAHGLPVYSWSYLWGEPGVGYMADEVAAVAPHAVHDGPGGFAMVDYGVLA